MPPGPATTAAAADTFCFMLTEMSDETRFYVVALAVVLVVATAVGIARYKRYQRTNPPLTRYERWCVKLSCFLSTLNGNLMNSLAVWRHTGKNSGRIRKSWGIANREDYEALMSEYRAGQRCRAYDAYVSLIKQYPTLSDEEIANREGCSAKKLALVRETYPQLSGNSILAFDYGTYAYLTRVAYCETLLTKDEAVANLRRAGDLVRSRFSSWDEFGYSYYAGAVFAWADTPKDVKNYTRVLQQCRRGWQTTPFAWKDEA